MSTAAPDDWFIPLTIRKTSGMMVPPANMDVQQRRWRRRRVRKAIAQAWSWRRKLEKGDASTILDIAQADGVTDRFASRMIRLAWLSPTMLEKLVLERCPPAVSIKDMIEAADLPWSEQEEAVLG